MSMREDTRMQNVIDLFAGAGGLSLGAARAGFKVAAAVENDPYAFETHCRNFPGTRHSNNDVAELKGRDLLRLARLRKGELSGIIGGPPCQGFSEIGTRNVDDHRNELFHHFFRLVKEAQPHFFIAENVPGILNKRYDGFRQQAFKLLGKRYELLKPLTITASDYGAPTVRTRIFFVGIDPQRFEGFSCSNFAPSKEITPIFVEEALKGLPEEVGDDWLTEERSWQPVSDIGDGPFWDSATGRIPDGVGDPLLVARYISAKQVSGCLSTRHSVAIKKRYEALKPGETDEISKSVKLIPNGFCPTLRAGTNKDKGSFQAVRPIHYKVARVITPREAARLQGFPDWFVFHPTKWHSFRQIGNSVSPIVAEALLSTISKFLKS